MGTWMTGEKVNLMEMFIFSLKFSEANTQWNGWHKWIWVENWKLCERIYWNSCTFARATANFCSTSRHFSVQIAFLSLWQIDLFPPHFSHTHSLPFVFPLSIWCLRELKRSIRVLMFKGKYFIRKRVFSYCQVRKVLIGMSKNFLGLSKTYFNCIVLQASNYCVYLVCRINCKDPFGHKDVFGGKSR